MLTVPLKLTYQDLVPVLCDLRKLPPRTGIKIYEEVRPGMILPVEIRKTLQHTDIEHGDILVFQTEKHDTKVDYPTVTQYYEYLHTRIVVPFKPHPSVTVKGQEFDLTLSRRQTYDLLVSKVAKQVGISDPQKLRLWMSPSGNDKPTAMVKRVPAMTIHEIAASQLYNGSVPIKFWYEPLDMSLQEME